MLRIPLPEDDGFALRIYAKISTVMHEGIHAFLGTIPGMLNSSFIIRNSALAMQFHCQTIN